MRRYAGCLRPHFYDLHVRGDAPLASEALLWIQRIYAIEDDVRGRPPDERRRARQARAKPFDRLSGQFAALRQAAAGVTIDADVPLARYLCTYPDQHRAWQATREAHAAASEAWKMDVKTATKSGHAPPLPPPAAPAEPHTPRLRQSDVTIERVATLLASAAPKGC